MDWGAVRGRVVRSVFRPSLAVEFSGPVWTNAWVIGGTLGAALAELLALQRPARRAASRWWYAPVGLAAARLSAGTLALGLRTIVQRPALDRGGAHRLVGACVALSGTALVISASSLDVRGWLAALFGLPASFLGMWSLLMRMTLARQTRWSVAHARAAAAVSSS